MRIDSLHCRHPCEMITLISIWDGKCDNIHLGIGGGCSFPTKVHVEWILRQRDTAENHATMAKRFHSGMNIRISYTYFCYNRQVVRMPIMMTHHH